VFLRRRRGSQQGLVRMSSTITVTIAQALASASSNLHVVDTAADIAAVLPNAALTARVHLFSLSAAGTLSAAAAEKLALLGAKFQLNGEALVVRDTLTAIDSAANAGAVALATQRVVADAAYNLLNAPGGAFAHATSVVLLGAPTLNVAQLNRLEALPGFNVDPSTHVTLADTLTAITSLMAAHPAWLLPVTSLSIQLDGNAIGAYTATQIATLEGHGTSVTFVPGGHNTVLPVTATAQDLAANATALNHLAGQVGLAFNVTDAGTTLTAAQGVALAGLADFSASRQTLYVADTGAAISAHAAALFGHGFSNILVASGTLVADAAMLLDPSLSLANGTTAALNASAVLSAAQTAQLLALPGFSASLGATITVADTVSNLIAHPAGWIGANGVEVTDSETVSAAQAVQVAQLVARFGGGFNWQGHTVTIADSPAALLALPPAVISVASGIEVSGNATVSAAQFTSLIDTLQANLGGHSVIVSDSAANLLALPQDLQLHASALMLSGGQSVSATQLTALAGLGIDFSTGGHALVVADGAAALAGLSGAALALASGEVLTTAATVPAALAAALAALPNFSLANGAALTVQDGVTSLLSLSPAALAVASGEMLNPGVVILTAAQAAGLAALPHFSTVGATITVADTVGALNAGANAGWQTLGAAVDVTDTAADLAAAAATGLLLNAAAVTLSGNAQISVAQAVALAGIPNFSTGGAQLTVEGSAAAIAANAAAVNDIARFVDVTDSGAVTAAQFITLIDTLQTQLAGHALIVSDSAANLLSLPQVLQLQASALVLSGGQSVSASQLAALAGLGIEFSTGGHALLVTDSAAALTGLSSAALALASGTVLNASATVSSSVANALAALPDFSLAGGATLTVRDTVASLLALTTGALAAASSEILFAGAVTVSAMQAAELAALPHFSSVGALITVADTVAAFSAQANAGWQDLGASVNVIDTATDLAAASASGLLQNATSVTLSGNAQISVAQAVALAGIPNFSAGAAQLTVAGSAAAVAAAAGAINVVATLAEVTDSGPVTAAQADELASLTGGGKLVFLGGGQLQINDDYAALTAAGNAAGVALAARLTVTDTADNLVLAAAHNWGAINPSYVLSADSAVTVAAATVLAGLGVSFSAGSYALTCTDTAAHLLALPSNVLALVGGCQLSANATVSAAQFVTLRDTVHVGLGGHVLTVSDSAAGLIALSGGDLSLVGACVLDANANVTAAQAAVLVGEPGLSTGGYALSVTDTAAALLALPTAALSIVSALDLTAAQSVTASQLTGLAALGGQFNAGGHAIIVADTAAALAALSAGALALATGEIVSQSATVSAATENLLAALPALTLAQGVTLTVQDSAAHLLSLTPNAMSVTGACVMNADADVTAAQAAALVAEPGFSTGGHILTVVGTQADILALSGAVLSVIGGAIVTASATLSVAQLEMLAAVPGITLAGGVILTVQDSAADLLALPAAAQALGGTFELSADATVDALQFAALRSTLHVTLGGYVLTISDSAAQLLALAGSDLSLASACILSGDATVTSARATSLAGEPGFSVGGHDLIIRDNAADLLAMSPSVRALASSLALADSQAVSATQLAALASLGGVFTTAGQILTVIDGADELAALGTPALALAAAEILGTSAVVSATEAAALAALPHFSLGFGVTLTVDANAASLLALPASVTTLATGYELAADAVVSASAFASLRDNFHVSLNGHSLAISDSAAGLLGLAGSDLSLAAHCTLNANATLGYAQAEALADEPGFSTGGYMLTVADSAYNLLALPQTVLGVAQTLELNGNQLVSTDELTGLAALGGQFSLNGFTITVEGSVPALLGLSANAQALSVADIVSQSAVVSVASANMLSALGDVSLGTGVSLTVDDTAGALLALPQSTLSLATGYELASDATVTAVGFVTLRDLLEVGLNGHALTITDSASNLLGLAGGNLALASACALNGDATVSVADALTLAAEPGFTAGAHVLTINTDVATLTQNLDILAQDFASFGGHFAVTLTDISPAMAVTAATYAADSALLDAITSPVDLSVTGGGASVAPLAAALAADSQVAQVDVTDSAVDVVENLAALLALGGKAVVTLTDQAPLAASLVPFLVQLPDVICGVGVSDTASQIAAVVEQAGSANSTAAITFLETNGVSLSGVSEVSVADLAALEQLGSSLNLNGNAIYVYDTVSHLTSGLAAAALATAVNDGLVSGVYVKAPGGILTMSAANALTLFVTEGVSTGYPPPQNGTIAVTVSDSAANIDAHAAALATLLGNADVAAIVVNASATVADAELADLQGLGASLVAGAALTVRDTAAVIAANAGAQDSGQSLAPAGWVLSGNATVTAAQAETLGALAHFSTGGYQLTLSLNANTAVSVAQANALGNIATALNLGGHELLVAGSAAQLAALSASALALVTPELSDSLANIAALPVTSPLLAGNVAVTDGEALTATQAASFLSLIASNGAPGIAIGSLSFGGHTETVSGTVAQLQALTASAVWSNTTALHGAFQLTASDTVANLIATGNTSFLAGLAGTTLAANATVSATAAETLAGLEAQINFSLGGHTLTIQDTAANLVALQNAAGVALANTIELSEPATLDAADAETLLANPHLLLNATLTIQDSSANLLDGALMTDITQSGDAAHIQVQLAGPETLDAETAASLVALPGFDDTQNLTIADSSAYLLASANLSAEQQAVAVTLAGDEIVSANTVLRLSEVPHFAVGDNMLTLAGNDFANAATLKAIADLGTQFSDGGHTITVTADVLDLTPAEYSALQNDGLVSNGHAISAVLVNDSIVDMNNVMALTATGVAGATVNIYDSDGHLLSAQTETQAGFTVTAPDGGTGHAFSITETVNGTESAPVVVLEANLLETAVNAADAQFASSGEIEVDSGKYLNLYSSTDVPRNLQAPALVYNATTHTISLDIPNASPITLITLGANTHPSSLDVSEILVKHHG
jgi:hypothetical protein